MTKFCVIPSTNIDTHDRQKQEWTEYQTWSSGPDGQIIHLEDNRQAVGFLVLDRQRALNLIELSTRQYNNDIKICREVIANCDEKLREFGVSLETVV